MENMEPAQLKPPPSPGTPLHPISPDRFNQQQSMHRGSLASAELSPLHNKGRNVPDIQSRVAYFSNLSRTSSPSAVPQSATTTAALQRAILGREEAEAALHATQAQLTEANARERRVSERLESLMEELHSLKERQAHERTIFEKEVRKARKEAFRAGSTLVKVQEELKYARGQMKSLKEDLKAEREAKDKAKQEAFERAYALAGLTEEMDAMKDKLRSMEADEKRVPEATTEEPGSETTPKKPIRSPQIRSSTPAPRSLKRDKPDSVDPKSPTRKRVFSGQNTLSPNIESPVKLQPSPTRRSCIPAMDSEAAYNERAMIEALKSELRWEKRLRDRAEDMVVFLKMECQFKRCSCRLAENDGTHYVHDQEWAGRHSQQQISKPTSRASTAQRQSSVSPPIDQSTQLEESQSHEQSELDNTRETDLHNTTSTTEEQPSTIMTFNPDTGTFLSVPSPRKLEEMRRAGQAEHVPQQSKKRSPSFIPSPPEKRRSGDKNHFTTGELSQLIDMSLERRSNSPSVLPNPTSPEPEHHQMPMESSLATEETAADHIIDSNTQTIPLADDKPRNASFGPVPGTPINREEALAQIRARRDRAQSALKRSASANDASPQLSRTAAPPVNGGRRIPRVENFELRGLGGSRRDISAPIGKYY